jgi:ankyrin repeat protein
MIDTNVLSELERHIRWGCTDATRQLAFFNKLESSPNLATDADEFGTTLLMIAASAANLEAVKHLCLLGSNASALASTGDTPLTCTIQGARDEPPSFEARSAVIETLLHYGANPNQLGWQGCSALHQAIIYAFPTLVQTLLLGGANPSVRLCDPPSEEDAIELAQSRRFRGTEQQRLAILALLTAR